MSSSSSAAAAAEAASEKRQELQSLRGKQSAEYFAAIVGGFMLIAVAFHWLQVLEQSARFRKTPFGLFVCRLTRSVAKIAEGMGIANTWIHFGRTALLTAYIGMNVGLAVWGNEWKYYTMFANRLGWLALCNMCLVVFLGLKNTPLSPLAGRSYESLNVLHRWCGYTTILLMLLHSLIYIGGLFEMGYVSVLEDPTIYAGGVAGAAMLVILVTAIRIVRNWQYEIFYVTHVLMVIVILIAVAFHQDSIRGKALIITLVAAGLWFLDRSLRLSRWIYYAPGNGCTITPLPGGATKVVMRRSIYGKPGTHALLWIPGVRLIQPHPFTLVDTNPAQFVITARDGFTKELHRQACNTPGMKLRAAIEGPYGSIPDVQHHDKVMLVAGGSGATFTMALALNWMRRQNNANVQSQLHFIWVVKSRDRLAWFPSELQQLKACHGSTVTIHVTGTDRLDSDSSVASTPTRVASKDTMEKSLSELSNEPTELDACIQYGRPNLQTLLRETLESTTQDGRVLVAACGPIGLMMDCKTAVASCREWQAPNLKLHLEEFSW